MKTEELQKSASLPVHFLCRTLGPCLLNILKNTALDKTCLVCPVKYGILTVTKSSEPSENS